MGTKSERSLGLYETVREAMLTGITVVLPLIVTLYVIFVLLNFVSRLLVPMLSLVPVDSVVVLGLVAALLITTLVFLVGLLAHSPMGDTAIDGFDSAISRVPGFGTVYRSFRRMGDAMLESDADNFRDVRLLEFPIDGSYTVAFVTANTPDGICEATGNDEMTTVFLPMAPNPVMGGFVINVPDESLEDVDMTVEEAFRTVVTSGVGIDAVAHEGTGLSEDELRDLTGYDPVAQAGTERNDEGD
ncbi:DUF502 domain-containing protein [Halomicrococcus sp. SG-WS-1]|uniref:DUF502 domain-containing protein n=1 Tax=Halomicrococcus sp. SG-WS-1 TaxID=3439057 RepID=UPI003F78DF7F